MRIAGTVPHIKNVCSVVTHFYIHTLSCGKNSSQTRHCWRESRFPQLFFLKGNEGLKLSNFKLYKKIATMYKNLT